MLNRPLFYRGFCAAAAGKKNPEEKNAESKKPQKRSQKSKQTKETENHDLAHE